jgi:hypothetical protein
MSQTSLYHHLVEGCLVTNVVITILSLPVGANASNLRSNKDCKRFDKDTINAGINKTSYKLRSIPNSYLVDGGGGKGPLSFS